MKICDFCGENLASFHCECCGTNYCKECASIPDEAGFNCPEYNCNYFGEAINMTNQIRLSQIY